MYSFVSDVGFFCVDPLDKPPLNEHPLGSLRLLLNASADYVLSHRILLWTCDVLFYLSYEIGIIDPEPRNIFMRLQDCLLLTDIVPFPF